MSIVQCLLGCIDFDNSISLKLREVQNKILRPVYKKPFINILLHRVRILLQNLPIGPQRNIFEKNQNGYKIAEFYTDFRSAGKSAKKHAKKGMSKIKSARKV